MQKAATVEGDIIAGQAVPLVVDLDGTLCRTDTLHEALLMHLSGHPMALVSLPGWLARGRAAFKARLAERMIVTGDLLPLNETVLGLVREARKKGRPVFLVSAADQKQAEAVAAPLGLFDEVVGTGNDRNLKGPAKADYLVDRFGKGGFDYVGDAYADLPVWGAARQAITVGAGPRLCRAVEAVNPKAEHLHAPSKRGRAMLKAMRPHQWSKNTLLFLPMLAAHDFGEAGVVAMAFLAFCFTASAVYIINDLLDLQSDRSHPRKRFRPFASGDLTAASGLGLTGLLLAGAVALGLFTGSLAFLAVLGGYLVTTFAYSLFLKRKLLVDVLALAGLYAIRIVAGGAAAGLALSPWLLGFSMFLFLSLAAVKRQAELVDQKITGRESAGRAYEVEDLPVLRGLALSAATAATLVLALYIASDDVQPLYNTPELLWLLCPVLLYWMLRMIMTAHRGRMTDDPIVFAARDRTSLLTIASCGFLVLVAAF
jgi:4-hydroxybenzoate polyprenyltransferase